VRSLFLAALAAALLLAAPAARAQVPQGQKWGSVEFGLGPYVPSIDKEFTNGSTPWRDIFGGSPAPLFRFHIGKAVYQSEQAGVVEVGFKTGFFSKAGHALDPAGNKTGDRTAFAFVPTSLTLTYRADMVWERGGVPLVPYVRGAFERYNWWVSKESKWTKSGATNGWSVAGGVALVLDWMDPAAAHDMDRESGAAHTMLYFDVTKDKVDDFGSSKSWDLTSDKLFWSAGLTVVF
jgi:hypothetical protein